MGGPFWVIPADKDGFRPPFGVLGVVGCWLLESRRAYKEIHLTASDPQSRPGRVRQWAPRRACRPVVLLLATVLLLLAGVGTVAAQERYSYTVTLSPTIGGSFSEGADNGGVQAAFSWRTQPRTAVGIRLGSIGLSGDQVGSFLSPTFRYVTIAGEYRFQELYYQSGVFFGLGLYQLGNSVDSEEGAGLTLGVSGDFPINERLSVIVELSGHYADIDAAGTYAAVHAGVAYQF